MKILYILDIKKKQKNFDFIEKIDTNESIILSLSPYSSYILDLHNISYITFHNIISGDDFKSLVFQEYEQLNLVFQKYQRYSYLMFFLSQLINYEIYLNILFKYVDNFISTYYITDTNALSSISSLFSNIESGVYLYDSLITIKVESKDHIFYLKEKVKLNISNFNIKKNKFRFLLNKLWKQNISFHYDNQDVIHFLNNIPPAKIVTQNIDIKYDELSNLLKKEFSNYRLSKYFIILIDNLGYDLQQAKKTNFIKIKLFTYLANNKDFICTLIFKDNGIPVIFTQHGSYLYKDLFLQQMEVLPADLNVVLNKQTDLYFSTLKSNKTKIIYSNYFNKKAKAEIIKYDYIYIINAGEYAGNGEFLYLQTKKISMDGNLLFSQHIYILNLFGIKFANLKFVIKLHPSIILSGLYVPFFEIAKKYKNIKLEIAEPIHSLIEKSEHIISDYFTSEFLNRNVFKKKIILINTPTTPIPEEELENMKKLFILVEDLEEIANKIKNIDKYEVCKDDELIDYYSSPKDGQDIVEFAKKIFISYNKK